MTSVMQQCPEAKIITNSNAMKELKKAGFKHIQSWNNLHAKLLLGENGALWGSWNFSFSHEKASRQEELVAFTKAGETEYYQLEIRFDEWWYWAKQNNRLRLGQE